MTVYCAVLFSRKTRERDESEIIHQSCDEGQNRCKTRSSQFIQYEYEEMKRKTGTNYFLIFYHIYLLRH